MGGSREARHGGGASGDREDAAFSTARNQLPTGLRTRYNRRLARGQVSCCHKVSDAANTLESLICIKINTCLLFPSDVNLHRHRRWPGGPAGRGGGEGSPEQTQLPTRDPLSLGGSPEGRDHIRVLWGCSPGQCHSLGDHSGVSVAARPDLALAESTHPPCGASVSF